jgi:hypothetical protein
MGPVIVNRDGSADCVCGYKSPIIQKSDERVIFLAGICIDRSTDKTSLF